MLRLDRLLRSGTPWLLLGVVILTAVGCAGERAEDDTSVVVAYCERLAEVDAADADTEVLEAALDMHEDAPEAIRDDARRADEFYAEYEGGEIPSDVRLAAFRVTRYVEDVCSGLFETAEADEVASGPSSSDAGSSDASAYCELSSTIGASVTDASSYVDANTRLREVAPDQIRDDLDRIIEAYQTHDPAVAGGLVSDAQSEVDAFTLEQCF